MENLEWSLIRAFLVVAETGSLSAAARAMGTSQPTVGRQIAALERELDAALFLRQPRGFVLTETGQALIAHARVMHDSVRQIALTAAGQQSVLDGTVRIAASVTMAYGHLPGIIAAIRRAEPGIQIDVVASDASSNLIWREADIAIHMYRPLQLELVTQYLGTLDLGLFATPAYLAGRPPLTAQNLAQFDFVGFDADPRIIEGFRENGLAIDRSFFGVRCDDPVVYWELVRAGCGIGFGQTSLGARDPLLQAVPHDIQLPTLPVWLTAHSTMRRTPRVRRVWTLLREGLAPLFT